MKAKKTLVAIIAGLLLNFTVILGFAITPRDLVAPFTGISIDERGKPGGSSNGGSSGSGSKGPKKTSRLNKGASKGDADAELSEWGMMRSLGDQIDGAPTAFQWSDSPDVLFKGITGTWQEFGINPDSGHEAEYGKGLIYSYQINIGAGAFHTDLIYTSENPDTKKKRNLPTSRRALTYNAWIREGGDPTKLRILSDDSITNPNARKAFENTFAAKGLNARVKNQYVQVKRGDPAWQKWDNGDNPFPDGYETMTIEYTNMQSTTTSVTLYVDNRKGDYHAIHTLEHIADLERRLQTRAEYFMRKNSTDSWLI
ncbi:hypothetical protein F5Y19DRAFT_484615 [Xylariaceae sp. FL1651]|nr:hypothetical protein F5Y19DRAFT_484615 [Xylariaceae sp. FL1651]